MGLWEALSQLDLKYIPLDYQNLQLIMSDEIIRGNMNASMKDYSPAETVPGNISDMLMPVWGEPIHMVITAIILGILILMTVIGNVFVIVAILTERNLKNIGNALILSLAVADLMVALLVMPLSAISEVTKQWILGPELCEMWTSCDVLSCTASILHLLAIAVDRYWAVTNVDYARRRDTKRISALITGVWMGSFVISFAPVFGWKDPDFYKRIEEEKRCLVSQNVLYQVFATCMSFYIPLIFILLLYWNIFKQARRRIRHRPGAKAVLIVEKSADGPSSTTPNSSGDVGCADPSQKQAQQPPVSENGVTAMHGGVGGLLVLAKREKKHVKESTEAKRERKAAKTLMIITGAFVGCWLPFFVMALLMAICEQCEPNEYLFSVLLWLGYINSLLNPIIYTIFSPDFRNAFKRMLCGVQYNSQRH